MIEDLSLEPIGHDFDVAAIRAYFASSGTAIIDPVNPEQYLLSSQPTMLREGERERREHPERVPYALTVVFPKPSCILIGIRTQDTGPAWSFVEWLRSRQPIKLLDQDFNDFTQEANKSLDFIFGPDDDAVAITGESQKAPTPAEFPIHYTLDNGKYIIETHVLGDGTQQLYTGRQVASGAPVFVTYDIRGSRRSIDELRRAVTYAIPGVLELGFVGGFDSNGGAQDYMCDSCWAIVEHASHGIWLPHALSSLAPSLPASPEIAITLGLSAGTILARAAAQGRLLTRIRPDYMWASATSGRWQITGLSARGDELFMRKSTDMVTPPVFDRYYYAPEWHREPDDRALVFSLAVMIAEWTMGRYPFKYLFHGKGLEQADHLPLVGPQPLVELLENALRFDPKERPHLDDFLAGLRSLES